MTANTKHAPKSLMTDVLQVLYVLFLGIVIASFIALGVETFYPKPADPVMPTVLLEQQFKPTIEPQTDDILSAQRDYDLAQKEHQQNLNLYSRNASIIVMLFAVVALALSLTVLAHWEIIANGFLLGGIFTLAYGILRGFMAEDAKFRFLVISIAAIVTLVLGYVKFVHKTEKEV